MRGYGQYCPVALAAEVFAERWTPIIIRNLMIGTVSLAAAQKAGGMAVAAPRWLARTLGEWGRLSPYAGITHRSAHSGRTSPEDTKQAS